MVKTMAGLSLLAGILGLIHQRFFTAGGWFNWEQFWHHESLIAMCFVVGLALLAGKYTKLGRR